MTRTVAPCTGAWIETGAGYKLKALGLVAPCTGAWIETRQIRLTKAVYSSPPARGRGLKRYWEGRYRDEKGRPLHGGVD